MWKSREPPTKMSARGRSFSARIRAGRVPAAATLRASTWIPVLRVNSRCTRDVSRSGSAEYTMIRFCWALAGPTPGRMTASRARTTTTIHNLRMLSPPLCDEALDHVSQPFLVVRRGHIAGRDLESLRSVPHRHPQSPGLDHLEIG